jgi:solute carrier family 25 phosphate transporter 23/24/25/41
MSQTQREERKEESGSKVPRPALWIYSVDEDRGKKAPPSRAGIKVDTLFAGGIAGACARTATAPLDRVKILMQTQRLTSGGAADKYTGLWQALRRVVLEDGFKGYFRGNLANCIRVIPYSATQFVTFDYCKSKVTGYTGKDQPTIVQRLGCGACAGICASFVTHPLDVVRTRLAVQRELTGIRHTVTVLWAEGGMASMYKGLGPTLASLAPFVAINFAAYDTIKMYMFADGRIPQGPLYSLSMGAAAGIMAQTACYPLDTIRRRMQLKGKNYTSTFDAIKTIIKAEGSMGLYRGISANTLKVIPNNAIRWMVFEHLKSSPYFKQVPEILIPTPFRLRAFGLSGRLFWAWGWLLWLSHSSEGDCTLGYRLQGLGL